MKIRSVRANPRRQEFEVRAGRARYAFPWARLRLRPSPDDPVEAAYPDPELGREAFTYRLRSGREDSVHLDAVREVALDPAYLQEVLLHRLRTEARSAFRASGLGVRHTARQLGTSPTQLYRLLDPDGTGTSLGQLLALLHLADREVELVVRKRRRRAPAKRRA